MKVSQSRNLLSIYSDILCQIKSPKDFGEICKIILTKLKESKLELVNQIVLGNMSLVICGKIMISFAKNDPINKHVINLVDYLQDCDLINKLYVNHFNEILKNPKKKSISQDLYATEPHSSNSKMSADLPFDSPNQKNLDKTTLDNNENECDKIRIQNALQENLNRLLNINNQAERYTKKNFGYSLLDLEGNFVWADKNTMQKLEFVSAELKDKPINLFNLMIPPSRKYLKTKFSEELFSDCKSIGDSKSFSYVIYSKTAVQDCLKKFKKMNVSDPDEVLLNSKGKEHQEMFTKFMKTISSRATLVMLSVNPSELNESSKIKNIKYNLLKNNLDRKKNINEDSDYIELFIFLETRLSGCVPDFDFSLLENDPKIQKFKMDMKKSLSKNLRKVEKKKRSTKRNICKKKKGNKNLLSMQEENQLGENSEITQQNEHSHPIENAIKNLQKTLDDKTRKVLGKRSDLDFSSASFTNKEKQTNRVRPSFDN